jgi:hypothetical protein
MMDHAKIALIIPDHRTMDQNVLQILANQKNIFITGDIVFLAQVEWLLIPQNKAALLVMSFFLTIHQLFVVIVR